MRKWITQWTLALSLALLAGTTHAAIIANTSFDPQDANPDGEWIGTVQGSNSTVTDDFGNNWTINLSRRLDNFTLADKSVWLINGGAGASIDVELNSTEVGSVGWVVNDDSGAASDWVVSLAVDIGDGNGFVLVPGSGISDDPSDNNWPGKYVELNQTAVSGNIKLRLYHSNYNSRQALIDSIVVTDLAGFTPAEYGRFTFHPIDGADYTYGSGTYTNNQGHTLTITDCDYFNGYVGGAGENALGLNFRHQFTMGANTSVIEIDPVGTTDGFGTLDFGFIRASTASGSGQLEVQKNVNGGGWVMVEEIAVGSGTSNGATENHSVDILEQGNDVQVRLVYDLSVNGNPTKIAVSNVSFTQGPADLPPSLTVTDSDITIGAPGTFTGVVATVSDVETATNSLTVDIAGDAAPNFTASVDSVDSVTGEVTVTVTVLASQPRDAFTLTLSVDDGTNSVDDTIDVLVDATIPQQDSTTWAYFYEATNILPDAEAGQTWSGGLNGSMTPNANTVSIVRPTGSGGADCRDDSGNWPAAITSSATSYTVEFRLHVTNDYNEAEDSAGFNVWVSGPGNNDAAYFRVGEDFVKWSQGGLPQDQTLDTNLNSDGFHTFRLIFDHATQTWLMYRDGVEIASGLTHAGLVDFNWLLWGDVGSAISFDAELDYVRWTPGAFLPPPPPNIPPTIDYTVAEPLTLPYAAGTTQVAVGTVSDAETSTDSLSVTMLDTAITTGLTVTVASVDSLTGELTLEFAQTAALAQGFYEVRVVVEDDETSVQAKLDILILGSPLTGGVPDPNYPYLEAWYSATDPAGVNAGGAILDGERVTEITDLGNKGVDLTLGSPKPQWQDNSLNGHPVFYFDGTARIFTGAGNDISVDDTVVFLVAKTDENDGGYYYDGTTGTQRDALISGFPNAEGFGFFNNVNGTVAGTTPTLVEGIWQQHTVVKQGTNFEHWLDGVLSTQETLGAPFSGTFQMVILGGRYTQSDLLTGAIAEMIVINEANLGASDREAIESYLQIKYNLPQNDTPIVSATATTTSLFLPDVEVTLTGTVTDLIPIGGDIASTWTLIGAPSGASATIVAPNDLLTTVTLSGEPGNYIFEVYVEDERGATGTATVDILLIDPVNLPPVVDAGEDQTGVIESSLSVTLMGSVTDPELGPTTATWSLKSGPTGSSADFGDENSAVTTATLFGPAGVYELELAGFDGVSTVRDTVLFTLIAPDPTATRETWSLYE